jgi:hypothetical protein
MPFRALAASPEEVCRQTLSVIGRLPERRPAKQRRGSGAIRAGPGKESAVLTPGNRFCGGGATAKGEMETDYRVRLSCRGSGGFGVVGRVAWCAR